MIMKIKKLLKIFGLLILAGNIVYAEYIKRNGEIYYREWMEQKPKLLKNIDKKSFEILENDFAKDKNNIYYQGEKMWIQKLLNRLEIIILKIRTMLILI